jgi:ABC-type multidrug transport system fused ATPase/permease subunit
LASPSSIRGTPRDWAYGPTGSGKSTITSLVARFYDPTAGVVKIDGFDIRRFQQSTLRQQIGFVLQETLLFHGTIATNIAYGKSGATEAETASGG